jgi:hypothetical protein
VLSCKGRRCHSDASPRHDWEHIWRVSACVISFPSLNSDRSWQKRCSASTDRSRFDRSLIDEDLADITRSLSLETRASAPSTFLISQDSCWSPNVWRRNPDAPSSARCQALPACGHALFPFVSSPQPVHLQQHISSVHASQIHGTSKFGCAGPKLRS